MAALVLKRQVTYALPMDSVLDLVRFHRIGGLTARRCAKTLGIDPLVVMRCMKHLVKRKSITQTWLAVDKPERCLEAVYHPRKEVSDAASTRS